MHLLLVQPRIIVKLKTCLQWSPLAMKPSPLRSRTVSRWCRAASGQLRRMPLPVDVSRTYFPRKLPAMPLLALLHDGLTRRYIMPHLFFFAVCYVFVSVISN